MIELGLQRITRLLSLGVRPLPWKAVHIAGTNGKGSTAALVAEMLHTSGYRVGRFTSPHFMDRWDCITLNQKTVSESTFNHAEAKVKARNEAESIKATEFEVLTATAFELFSAQSIEIAVVECGLGGRGDSTNVLRPQDVLVSVVTKIGLDHTEFLGDTIEAIAREKSGIIKENVPVVLDSSNIDIVKRVVREVAEGLGGRRNTYVEPQQETVQMLSQEQFANLAEHQKQNIATAYTAFQIGTQQLTKMTGGSTSTAATQIATVKESLPSIIQQSMTSMPGRLQWIDIAQSSSLGSEHHLQGRPVHTLLDGAHNLQASEALSAYVDKNLRQKGTKITWMLGVKTDKDVDALLSILLRTGERVVVTSFSPVDGMPWVKSRDPADLAMRVEKVTLRRATIATNIDEAIKKATSLAGDGPLVITGSLYLVSDVLRWLRNSTTNLKP